MVTCECPWTTLVWKIKANTVVTSLCQALAGRARSGLGSERCKALPDRPGGQGTDRWHPQPCSSELAAPYEPSLADASGVTVRDPIIDHKLVTK